MQYPREATGKGNELCERVGRVARGNHFEILGTLDPKAKMTEKGVPFDHDGVTLEVCNPYKKQAKEALDPTLAVWSI